MRRCECKTKHRITKAPKHLNTKAQSTKAPTDTKTRKHRAAKHLALIDEETEPEAPGAEHGLCTCLSQLSGLRVRGLGFRFGVWGLRVWGDLREVYVSLFPSLPLSICLPLSLPLFLSLCLLLSLASLSLSLSISVSFSPPPPLSLSLFLSQWCLGGVGAGGQGVTCERSTSPVSRTHTCSPICLRVEG